MVIKDLESCTKKYSVIYADPPWKFGSKQISKKGGERFHSLDEEYHTLKTDEMEKWDVARIAKKDSAIFMWTTNAHVEEAIRLMKAWGFKYKTIAFVWSKLSNKGNEVYTLGAWTMQNCEIVLFGTRGSMLQNKKSNSVLQLVKAERTAHSKKPNEVRKRIENLFGDVPKIELFARETVDGWDCFGDEV